MNPPLSGPDHPSSGDGAGERDRAEYLLPPGLIYLQTGSMGPCTRSVIDATLESWLEMERDPTDMAYWGATFQAAERVRQLAGDLLGCSAAEIAITRSTTDGMNAVAQGLRLTPGSRVLTSSHEHEGGEMGWQYLAAHHGIGLDVVPLEIGEHDPGAIVARFAAAIRPATRVLSVSHVLSTNGLRMPIAELSALARARGILCVVDGAQSAGCMAVDVKALGCHAYATGGHKWLMGPKGTGILYVAEEAADQIRPMQFHESRACYNHSTGVANLPGIIGLGAAIEAAQATGIEVIERHNMALRDRCDAGLRALDRVTVVSAPPGPEASPLVTFRLPDGEDNAAVRARLRDEHRMIVKQVPRRWVNGIRLSPHIFNRHQEVDAVLGVLREWYG